MKNYKLQIQPEAYMLKPFKEIWERDKSKDKRIALEELAYIYFMADFTSDFSDILDEEERHNEVVRSVITIPKWHPDELVINTMEFYTSRQRTIALTLLEDARHGISKLSSYLRDINFNEVDVNPNSGEVKPKHDIKKFADTIRQIPAIVGALKELEETVKKEQESERGLRGGKEKGMYVD